MKQKHLWLTLVFLTLVFACTIPTPPPLPNAPTATPRYVDDGTWPTDTPGPAFPEPTATRVPTRTPVPTVTRTPTRTPAPPVSPLSSPVAGDADGLVRLDTSMNLNALPILGPLMVHFPRSMDPSSTADPLVFIPPIDGRFIWDDTQMSLVFIPLLGFVPDQEYQITLSRVLKTAEGHSLPAQSVWTVTAAPAPEVTSFRLYNDSETFISDTGHVGAREVVLRLDFSVAMHRESVADALKLTPSARYSLFWEENVLNVRVSESLKPGTDYVLSLGNTARDTTGTPVVQAQAWSFTTLPVVRKLAVPEPGDVDQLLKLYFNYSMDPDSVEEALRFTPPLSGTFSWNPKRDIATFAPDDPMPAYTDFTLSFARRFMDADGAYFAPPSSLPFTSPPPVLAALPSGRDQFPGVTVRVTFDRLMDEASTEAAFTISPTLTGTLSWDETTLIFKPEQGYLDGNTAYAVTLGTGARGRDGEELFGKPYTWDFSTGNLTKIVGFGDGPNAQSLDAAGRRAVQFMFFSPQEGLDVSLALYGLSVDQFLDRYASGFRGVMGWEINRGISTADTTLVKRWSPIIGFEGEGGGLQRMQEAVIPDDVPPGLYILELESGYVNDQLLLVLTNNTLLLKQAEGQIVAWLADIPDRSSDVDPEDLAQIGGQAVSGATVSVYTRAGEALARSLTNADGVAGARVERTDPAPYLIIAQDGEDFTVAGLSDEWRSDRRGWWDWWVPVPQARRYAAYIYTDRPIYKPGQQVFFKAIVRQDDDAVIRQLPSGTPVVVRIRDARNNVVRTFEMTTNAFGSVDGVFDLAEGSMLGKYAVEAVLDGETHRQVFKVEDYRKPDYEISFEAFPKRVVAGDALRFDTTSAYFFGEPVAGADIEINLFESYERYWWESSEDGRYAWYTTGGGPLFSGKTRDDGSYGFSWKPHLGSYAQSVAWGSDLERSVWGIEATVSDRAGQTVSGFTLVEVYNAAERITVNPHGYLHKPGEPFPVDMTVVDLDGVPVAGRDLEVSLRRWVKGDYDAVIQSFDVSTVATGRARLDLTVEEPGYYQLRVSGEDALGNPITSRTYVYAYGGWAAKWYGRNSLIEIDADRVTYAPGDTAHLVIESAFDGPALLTFERGTTRRAQMVELTSPVTSVDVPILADDVPNIFVTVNAWQGQRLGGEEALEDLYYSFPDAKILMDTVELRVPATSKALTVTLTSEQEVYAPREEVTFTLRVTDYLSRPVRAEVSLALVDEAIFALSEELSGPMPDAFYALRQRIVRTYDAMALLRIMYGRDFGGGGGGGEEGYAGNPRSDFPDTAAWFPALQTAADGTLALRLRLPDSLTRWRLTAKAVTAETQVGEVTLNVTTHQEVVVRPLLPRILTAGDDVLLSAMVHNYSDASRTLSVTLEISPAVDVAPLAPLTLEPGEQQVAGWTATLTEPGLYDVLVQAVTSEGGVADAVSLPLSVQPLAVPDVTTTVGQFQSTLTTTVVMPEDALAMSSVHVELSRSIAGTLLSELEYLTGFPYGCVEQTMSKALPNAVVGRAINLLGVSDPQLEADLPPRVEASLQRLYGYQHNDGGWGWWYDDSTHDYQTAWVVFGLATTREAGYEVDTGVIERGVVWLNSNLAGMDIRTRAYALYSMAVAGSPNVTQTLVLQSQLVELDTFSQAGLALALQIAGETEAADAVVSQLVETATARNGVAYWETGEYEGHYYNKTMASRTRSTALALSALVEIRPDSPLIPDVVRWLMGQRKQYGWGSTNETAYSIIALTDHLLATSFSEAATSTRYTVSVGDTIVGEGSMGRGEPAVSVEIPAAQLQAGENTLVLTHSGTQYLYYVVSTRAYLPQSEIEAAGEVFVRRRYFSASGREVTTVQAGDLIEVQVEVRMPKDASYIIIEDHLPGGLEALNERLNTTSRVASAYEEVRYYWQDYGYNRKEVWGDRVSFFVTEFGEGSRTFKYYARATHAGIFVAMPVEVSAMYDASIWGRSSSRVLSVEE